MLFSAIVGTTLVLTGDFFLPSPILTDTHPFAKDLLISPSKNLVLARALQAAATSSGSILAEQAQMSRLEREILMLKDSRALGLRVA